MPVNDRLRYFDSVVTPVAFLGSGHRTIHHIDLHARGMKLFMIGMESCIQLHGRRMCMGEGQIQAVLLSGGQAIG